jgi:hypothetical protein
MPLFTDLPEKIISVEESIPPNLMPWLHLDGQGRTI